MLIPYPELSKRHSLNPIGVLHIGASTGQESDFYANAGIENVVWVEAIPEVFKQLKQNVSCYPNNIALNACISDKDNETVMFNISSNGGESSSVFEFDLHSQYHPDVTFVDKIQLKTTRVDSLFIKKGIDIRNYDYLSLDLQGSELAALKSMGDMLRLFRFCYVEVNKKTMYKNMPLVGEIDAYLANLGFEGVEEKYTGAGWGDKLYIKKYSKNSVFKRPLGRPAMREGMVLNIPNEFMVEMPFRYPDDNVCVFEKWYYENFNEPTNRLYLGVQWTAYHVGHNFGNDIAAIKKLQDWIDTLDRSKKYYTIHQFDLGCMVDFKDLDILVFGMAGGRIDYCLPLLCMPHKFEFNNPKTLFASFVGRKTNPIRDRIIEHFKNKQGCYVNDNRHDLSSYCSILSSSIFGLCPLGFGANSFRLMESLQYGAIPVIIGDKRLEPYGIPFEDYGYYIDANDEEINCESVYYYLQSLPASEIQKKQANLKYYYNTYFTYEASKILVLQQLKK